MEGGPGWRGDAQNTPSQLQGICVDADCESGFLLAVGRCESQVGSGQVLTLCGSDAISEGVFELWRAVTAPFGIAWALSLVFYSVF